MATKRKQSRKRKNSAENVRAGRRQEEEARAGGYEKVRYDAFQRGWLEGPWPQDKRE